MSKEAAQPFRFYEPGWKPSPEQIAEMKKFSWKLEAEMKFLMTPRKFVRVMKKVQEDKHAEVTFVGTFVTQWFNDGLPQGASARIREVINDNGTRSFMWTIKLDPLSDVPTVFLKNKIELEGFANGRESAYTQLIAHLQLFGIISSDTQLKKNLEVKKNRLSYAFEKGPNKGFEFDFDELVEVNGVGIEPVTLLEIEMLSQETAYEKKQKITERAAHYDLKPDRRYAAASTRKLLKELNRIPADA